MKINWKRVIKVALIVSAVILATIAYLIIAILSTKWGIIILVCIVAAVIAWFIWENEKCKEKS